MALRAEAVSGLDDAETNIAKAIGVELALGVGSVQVICKQGRLRARTQKVRQPKRTPMKPAAGL